MHCRRFTAVRTRRYALTQRTQQAHGTCAQADTVDYERSNAPRQSIPDMHLSTQLYARTLLQHCGTRLRAIYPATHVIFPLAQSMSEPARRLP
jgi:hypothetical protein